MNATHTHYIEAFTTRDARGRQQAACGVFVALGVVAQPETAPTCPHCLIYVEGVSESEGDPDFEDDRADHQMPARTPLSRFDRLQALADAGFDTWSEARGER